MQINKICNGIAASADPVGKTTSTPISIGVWMCPPTRPFKRLTHAIRNLRLARSVRHSPARTAMTEVVSVEIRRGRNYVRIAGETTHRSVACSNSEFWTLMLRRRSRAAAPAYGGRKSISVQLWAYSVSLNGELLLANPLQSSSSTFSWGSFLSFFAFQDGMLGTQISARGGWPTVSGDFSRHGERFARPLGEPYYLYMGNSVPDFI